MTVAGDTATVGILDPENGRMVTERFSMIDGLWHLTEVTVSGS